MTGIALTRWNKERVLLYALLFIGLIGAALAFKLSYFSNTNVLIGLALFPFSFFISGSRRNNFVYTGLLVFFLIIAATYGIRICYYFALAFYFFWVLELFVGRLNVLVVFLVVFMSPFFIQVITILGFPLRLILSSYAGTLLNVVGANVQVEGNMMIVDGAMFSVDEACMGLNMLVISMLMGAFVLAYRYRRSRTMLGLYPSGIFFGVVFALNVITNLARIIVLVYFGIPPEDPMHEFVGILCLVVYVLIPLHFLSKWFVRKYGKARSEGGSQNIFNRSSVCLMIAFPLVVLGVGSSLERLREASAVDHADVQFDQGTPEQLSDGITKISTKNLLIYVKTIPEFFTGEHTPLLCWKGSGYEFSGVTTATVAGVTIYIGTLIKDGSTLHTAWWYSNGQIQTVSQIDWRMRMLKGESKFCLVNVTAKDEQTLLESIRPMFTTNPLIIKN